MGSVTLLEFQPQSPQHNTSEAIAIPNIGLGMLPIARIADLIPLNSSEYVNN